MASSSNHTMQQIDALEWIFQVCPHPDEALRMQLSMELGMEPHQVQLVRDDNVALQAEKDKLRDDNMHHVKRGTEEKIMLKLCTFQ